MLLLLDNFEQVLTAGPAIAELVASCPDVTVLATSRAPLRLRWEHEVSVAPLELPNRHLGDDLPALACISSVALFLERARSVRPGFALHTDNAADVAAICARVQGLPLAIELAAARVRILSPRALLTRLVRSGASSTLDMLSDGPSDLPRRQRSLRDTIAWSYELLSPTEQAVFRRLAVFAGGCTLDAAEAVCGAPVEAADVGDPSRGGSVIVGPPDVFGALLALVEKNMVVQQLDQDGEHRFGLLEAMDEFGHDRLAACHEEGALRRAHARYYLDVARSTARHLSGPTQAGAVHSLELEHHNFRAAMQWSLSAGDAEDSLRLCAALTMFWYIKGHYREGREWCARALSAAVDAAPATRAAALHGAASLADIQHDNVAGRSMIEESVALWRVAGKSRGLAASLSLMGMLARHDGDRELARRSCAEALTIYATAPDPWGERLALGVLGWLAEDEGDHATAERLLEASLAAARRADSPTDIALQLNNLGIVAIRRGDDVGSERRHRAALILSRDVDAHEPMAGALEGLAAVAAGRRDHARAAWLVGAATALRGAIGSPRIAQFEEEHQTLSRQLRSALGEDELVRLAGRGGAAALDDVIAVAMATREPPGVLLHSPGSEPRHDGPVAAGSADLTPRQVEYLRLLAQGCTNRAIAATLVVSETAVEQMLVRLYVKIGVRNRSEAIRYSYEHRLVVSSTEM
jgi:predicted ATPase/DNA-binding CsgD family transcriptional regulator